MNIRTFWFSFLLLWAGLLIPWSLHSQVASLSFTRHDLTTGGNPLAVASADFNGDGNQDVAVLFGPTGGTTTFVAVFLGNGNGTFSVLPEAGFNTGFAAPWLITADLNHDNKPDLVIANGFGRSISVLLGNGDGTFGTKNVIPLPGRIESVIAADFNGDGKLDLAAPDFEPQPYAVSILLGNGDGTFGSNTDYPTLAVPYVVIADDFDHDGRLDLALNTDLGTASVIGSVLLGNGDGTFQLKKDFSTGFAQSADLASGDFNSDGKSDLAVTNNADDSVSILLGNGDGTFTLQSSIALPVTPFRVLARDIDADGKLDLVVARRNSARVSILTGKGDGTFGTPIDFATGTGPQFLVAADLNGDGKLDLVTANDDAGSISILLNTTGAINPTPRAWLGGAVVGNTLFTVGGGVGGGSGFGGGEVSTVEAYDPVGNSWTTKSSLSSPRFGLTTSASNGIVYAIGGTFSFSSTPLSTVEAYAPATNTWSSKSGLPTGRWKLTSSTVNGIIYAIGGGATGNQCVPTGTVEAYDPVGNSWATKGTMPTARWGAASDVIGGQIYVVGGSQECPQISVVVSAALEVYDPSTDTWASEAPMSTPRWDLAAAATNGKLYAIGGWDPVNQKALDTVEEFDPSTNSWAVKSPMPTARSGIAAMAINNKIYVFGGVNQFNQVLLTLEVYDPATDTWSTPPRPNSSAAINVSPTQITFSPTVLNTTSSPVQVTVSNTGTANLVLEDIATQDPFALTNFSSNITSSITPNTQGTFDVIFRPTTAGPFSGNVTILSNAPTSPTMVALQGTVMLPSPPPSITSMSPRSGNNGQTLIGTVTGTYFQPGATLAFSGSGITATLPYLAVTSTQIIANIRIASNAPLGPNDAIVTNPDGQQGRLSGGFSAFFSPLVYFALKGLSGSTDSSLTPYRSPIVSVFDHSMRDTTGSYSIYSCDGTVQAFGVNDVGTGVATPCNMNSYQNTLGLSFSVNGHYSGNGGNSTFLNYEGHPGFDYRAACTTDKKGNCLVGKGTNVYSVASGHVFYPSLMVGVCATSKCKHPPSQYHVMELIPDGAPTVFVYYLHLSTYKDTKPFTVTDPSPALGCPPVVTLPLKDGSPVGAGCIIAQSGNTSPNPIPPHLHLEIQRAFPLGHFATSLTCSVGGTPMACIPMDPYGWDGNGCTQDPYAAIPGVSNDRLWSFQSYLSLSALCFGNQQIGVPSNTSVVTLTNIAPTNLMIGSMTVAGPHSSDFLETTTCPAALLSGQTCTINVTFNPTMTGQRKAVLNIRGTDGGSPPSVVLAVSLTGVGT